MTDIVSRLDRLYILLENGSNRTVRSTAAKQISECVIDNPNKLSILLNRTKPYLYHTKWDTRIAAAETIQYLSENSSIQPSLYTTDLLLKEEHHTTATTTTEHQACICSLQSKYVLTSLNISEILKNASKLLSSRETDYCDDTNKKSLIEQKESLINKLGGGVVAGGHNSLEKQLMDDIFSPLDFVNDNPAQNNSAGARVKSVKDILKRTCTRKRGRASQETLPAKKIFIAEDVKVEVENVTKDIGNDATSLNLFCSELCEDLFRSSWITRHGAASGLHSILKIHWKYLGTHSGSTECQQRTDNLNWLEDISVRLICVLALDRFGDYICDEVVAPVRQTCAMTLGRCTKGMSKSQIWDILKQLLLKELPWEVRHGAILAIQYILITREDLVSELLPLILAKIVNNLTDDDDDVRSVSADLLLHVVPQVIDSCQSFVSEIIALLWQSLLYLDDLTSSTNSIMSLLSSIIAHNINYVSIPADYIPRLFPFFSHTNASVRLKTLITLKSLLKYPPDVTETANWVTKNLTALLRHLYQRALVESDVDIQSHLLCVWNAILRCDAALYVVIETVSPLVATWLNMACQHYQQPLDSNNVIVAEYADKPQNAPIYYLGSIISDGVAVPLIEAIVIRSRLLVARLLSTICELCAASVESIDGAISARCAFSKLLCSYFNTKSCVYRFVIAAILFYSPTFFGKCLSTEEANNSALYSSLLESLKRPIYHDEIMPELTTLQSLCRQYIEVIGATESYKDIRVISVEVAITLANQQKTEEEHEEKRKSLLDKCIEIKNKHATQLNRISCLVSCVLIRTGILPDAVNPYLRPVMFQLRQETNEILQEISSVCLVTIITTYYNKQSSPVAKVIANLCDLKLDDCTLLSIIGQEEKECLHLFDQLDLPSFTKVEGIVTLSLQQHPILSRGRRLPKIRATSMEIDLSTPYKAAVAVKLRGVAVCMNAIFGEFREKVFESIPIFDKFLFEPLLTFPFDCRDEVIIQNLVNSLHIMELSLPFYHVSFKSKVHCLLKPLYCLLSHSYSYVRFRSARCIAIISKIIPTETLSYLIQEQFVLLKLTTTSSYTYKGTVETISQILMQLDVNTVLPFCVIIASELLALLSSHDKYVRLLSNTCFSNLIHICSLEASIKDPKDMPALLSNKRLESRAFFNQLQNGNRATDYVISIHLNVELRNYQKEGVNWLAFLCRYGLHGILCDDMGLGKTIQMLILVASEHNNDKSCNSIVICPPTLTGHWLEETTKFIPGDTLSPMIYIGTLQERIKLRCKLAKHNFIITSYEAMRSDIDYFSKIQFNFCVLDEGHIIKNSKTKLSRTVKQLKARHRIILTGTPIQNNVLELWSLFDFLMPGYLGTEKQFWNVYAKPVIASKDSKCTAADIERGDKAISRLHKQALPFILRRLKEDVLKDLPPKIIQDYYCDLSPLQRLLYKKFNSTNDDEISSQIKDISTKNNNKAHIFKTLHYLRKLCNHPKLVLNPSHAHYETIMRDLKKDNKSLDDIDHSPKLNALKQILSECGIGVETYKSDLEAGEYESNSILNGHRVLVFSQQKEMLNIIEKDLFLSSKYSSCKPITYLRMDGATPVAQRSDIVSRFNSDPSIDVLLLTTRVGGLGLTLTGADTVVFIDHDWNPSFDLQAMDRAHRIGQKKVVNVYRLITRNTLEEKIMGLQKFKQNISKSVISDDNKTLCSMRTDQVLDLFSCDDTPMKSKTASSSNASTIIASLEDLWDCNEYRLEYNTETYINDL